MAEIYNSNDEFLKEILEARDGCLSEDDILKEKSIKANMTNFAQDIVVALFSTFAALYCIVVSPLNVYLQLALYWCFHIELMSFLTTHYPIENMQFLRNCKRMRKRINYLDELYAIASKNL